MDKTAVFPNWLKRLDPTLAAAEQVAVYQAFRLRRKVHTRQSLARRLRGIGSDLNLKMVLIGTPLVLAAVVAFLLVGCLAIPLIAIVGIVASTMFRRERNLNHVMPRRLGTVFSPSGFLQDAAIDLWMAGATGREVLLGIYAEHRESRGVPSMFAFGFLYLIFALSYYLGGEQYHIPGLLFGAALLWAMIEFWLIAQTSWGNDTRHRFLEPQLFVWESDAGGAVGRLAGLRLGRSVRSLLIVVLVLLPLGSVAFGVAAILSYFGKSVTFLRTEIVVAIVLSLVAVMLAVGCRVWRPYGVEKLVSENDLLLARADAAFDRFMAATVVADPDGAAWARWRHSFTGTVPPAAPVAAAGQNPPAAPVIPPEPPPT